MQRPKRKRKPEKPKTREYRLNVYMKSVYGITKAEYDVILKKQNGECPVCFTTAENSLHGRLYIDHNHTTGKVRGLLCNQCNCALGNFKDNIDNLLRAAMYLEERNED